MIEVTDLRFGYGKRALFDELSLTLRPGNIYGLLGRNGAGKTSLLRILSGQLYRAAGKCSVLGKDPGNRTPGMLAEIYYLPEEYYVPAVKPHEYLARYSPFYPLFSRSKFEDLQREFELPAAQKLSEYSFGQKKKFLIAFALASECSLILLDEPTNGLDIPSKSQFRRVVASSISDHQTFIISTHQVRDMENLIDPVIIVDEGRIIFQVSVEEVSRRLLSKVTQDQSGPSLYAEKALGGYITLVENPGDTECAIDMELLFNAVIDPGRRVRELFSKGGNG
jgi:ABC-2 type transport system ATP-binding protein